MLLFQAIVLGIIQGLTEFIPISSSAHLVIVPWLFQWDNPALTSLSFDVSLHLGTLIAVLLFFASDWVRLLKAGVASVVERKIGDHQDRRLAWMLLIGCIPGGIIGALAEDSIEHLFHDPNATMGTGALIAMAVLVVIMAGLMFTAERLARHLRGMDRLTFKDAILIGTAQALAVFPGVSRSGATITAGLALGLNRESAARFSFLLSAPIIGGAGLKSLLDVYEQLQRSGGAMNELVLIASGFLAAAVSGYLAIKFLLRYLQKNSTDLFVYYRVFFAAVIIVFALLRN
ncbi:MAG: undecaprenyl-diphosphatase UppP [Chitinivibrionales bacterium]|nr:undecaprenyl-diphosphatase UppP [Chitinivibrionales bacterium]